MFRHHPVLTAATALMVLVLPVAGRQAIHLRSDALIAMGILGVLGTGIAYSLNYRLISDEGTTASVVTYLLPVVAVILGASILGDHITVQITAGMLIVLAGVAVIRRDRRPPAQPRHLSPNDQPGDQPRYIEASPRAGGPPPRR